jgi:hypothetical protein
MAKTYFFTIATGRCGQSSLTKLLNTHVPDCYAAFEEPKPNLHFKGIAGVLERRFRRKFFETHELLGRGKVLMAFENDDQAYLDSIATKRLRMINAKTGSIHFDVSKYFARGLYKAFARSCPGMGVVLLVRDPVLNMRSFLNRNKPFTLDNNMPSAKSNVLRLPCEDFEEGELYLWAWCEMYLRYLDMLDTCDIGASAIIRTEDLNDAEKMTIHFDALGLPYDTVQSIKPRNTNAEQGKGKTVVTKDDMALFQSFLTRLPKDILKKITYLEEYASNLADGMLPPSEEI